MTKFFNIFKKKPVFGPFLAHFPNFWRNFFLENRALSSTTSYGFVASCQNLEKTNDSIPRKHLDRQKDRRTDRRDRPYFIGSFWLPLEVQKWLICISKVYRYTQKTFSMYVLITLPIPTNIKGISSVCKSWFKMC